jgi:AcrR family transcriptional regulator
MKSTEVSMPRTAPRKGSGAITHGHILAAAIRRFCEHSYEDTRLRDIAADVGVDVALVHRSFGSKENLFHEAVKTATRPDAFLVADRSDLGMALAKRIFEPDRDEALASVDPLAIFVRSLSSPQALPLLREFSLKNFIAPLADKLGDAGIQRATLVAACLTGIKIFRDVLLAEGLGDEARSQVEPLVIALLDTLLGDVGSRDASP